MTGPATEAQHRVRGYLADGVFLAVAALDAFLSLDTGTPLTVAAALISCLALVTRRRWTWSATRASCVAGARCPAAERHAGAGAPGPAVPSPRRTCASRSRPASPGSVRPIRTRPPDQWWPVIPGLCVVEPSGQKI